MILYSKVLSICDGEVIMSNKAMYYAWTFNQQMVPDKQWLWVLLGYVMKSIFSENLVRDFSSNTQCD